MMQYGNQGTAMGAAYGSDFAAQPKVVQGKQKYKDPYGGVGANEYVLFMIIRHIINVFYVYSEYLPQNIMYDRRIARGSTYAAMVIPAGSNPDAMIMERRQEERKKRSGKSNTNVT
jgi:hypothetical protein